MRAQSLKAISRRAALFANGAIGDIILTSTASPSNEILGSPCAGPAKTLGEAVCESAPRDSDQARIETTQSLAKVHTVDHRFNAENASTSPWVLACLRDETRPVASRSRPTVLSSTRSACAIVTLAPTPVSSHYVDKRTAHDAATASRPFAQLLRRLRRRFRPLSPHPRRRILIDRAIVASS